MPNIGLPELAILLVIVLIFVGPKKLPGFGRSLGTGMREFKDSISGDDKDDKHELEQSRAAAVTPPTPPAQAQPVAPAPAAPAQPAAEQPPAAPAEQPAAADAPQPPRDAD